MTISQVGTPFSNMKEPDTKIMFEDLVCTFKLTENFDGYLEIYNWIKGLGFSQSFTEYSNLKGDTNNRSNIFTDVILTIYDNSSNPNIEVHLYNAFPYSLSSVNLDTTVNDATFNTIEARFAYDYHNISKIS